MNLFKRRAIMKSNSSGFAMTNPVIGKMVKKTSEMEPDKSLGTASYSGIANKTLFFMATTVIGVVLYFILHQYLLSVSPADMIVDFVDENEIFAIHMSLYEVGVLILAGVLALIMPLAAWLLRSTIPVTGVLFTVSQGYFIGCISEFLVPEYKWIGILALVLTIAIVGVMLFLYAKRIVRVTKRFRTVMMVLFPSIIIGGFALFILGLIPGVRNAVEGLNSIMQNPVVSIISSIVFIIIAALFLLADFNAIEECVENGMPKKLEWMAAFGLAYTIIYIYFKILNLLLKLVNKSDK